VREKEGRGGAIEAARAARTLPPSLINSLSLFLSPLSIQLEIKEYLRAVYNLDVASVRTLIAQGKKKRGKHGHYRRPDVKKAFVTLKGDGPKA